MAWRRKSVKGLGEQQGDGHKYGYWLHPTKGYRKTGARAYPATAMRAYQRRKAAKATKLGGPVRYDVIPAKKPGFMAGVAAATILAFRRITGRSRAA